MVTAEPSWGSVVAASVFGWLDVTLPDALRRARTTFRPETDRSYTVRPLPFAPVERSVTLSDTACAPP